jgi:hypothetical protein
MGAGVVAALVLVVTPAAAAPARTIADSKSRTLTTGNVVHAFATGGLKMFNPLLGAEQGVVTLSVENAPSAYSIGASIYLTAREASEVYNGEKVAWIQAGFDVALRGNVIITVVPKGAALGRKHPQIALPVAVAKALVILKADLAR